MKRFTFLVLILSTAISTWATTVCTTEPENKWMKKSEFVKKVEALGYKIDKFEKKSSCYEIEGLNKSGQKVEVDFNPVNATVVKEELEH